MVEVPKNFDGSKFVNKYNLRKEDFYIDKNGLHCKIYPNLTHGDIIDCVCDESETLSLLKLAIEQHQNEEAIKRDYISMDRLLAHSNSTNPQWREEAQKMWAWKDANALKAYEILAAVKSGQIPIPTISEFLAMLPKAPE